MPRPEQIRGSPDVPRHADRWRGQKLESYLTRAARDLPVRPKVAADVIRAVDDEETPVSRIRGLIDQDTAIAARVLKVSNSSFYGFQGQIQSLDQAIMLIGRRVMKNLVPSARRSASIMRS